MSVKLRCDFLGHKWMLGEATNEPGVPVICRRCGRLGSHVQFPGGKTANPADMRKDLDHGGGMDQGGGPL